MGGDALHHRHELAHRVAGDDELGAVDFALNGCAGVQILPPSCLSERTGTPIEPGHVPKRSLDKNLTQRNSNSGPGPRPAGHQGNHPGERSVATT